MSTITQNAVSKMNEERQAKVLDQAMARLHLIKREREKIADFREEIKLNQEEANKLSQDVLTPEGVLGRPASQTPTANEITILKALEEMNKERQKEAEQTSKCYLDAIEENQKYIKRSEEEIAALTKQLNELSVSDVTVAQLLG